MMPRWRVAEKRRNADFLSPIRFAQGKLFACHSERSEESLSFRAQGKLREESRPENFKKTSPL